LFGILISPVNDNLVMGKTVLNSKSPLGSFLLLSSGAIVGIIALGHIAIIFGGAEWFRAFGAGERMATMAENGSFLPALSAFAIAVILMVWSLYAYCGATCRFRLPFLKSCLLIISSIFILRGVVGIASLFLPRDGHVFSTYDFYFMLITSAGSFYLGITYLIGVLKQWEFIKSSIV